MTGEFGGVEFGKQKEADIWAAQWRTRSHAYPTLTIATYEQ